MIAWPEARARNTDPGQSKRAAKKVTTRNQCGRSLVAIWRKPDSIGPEVCPLNAQARITDLERLGLIEETGERDGARTWRVTGKGEDLANALYCRMRF
jgi:hypothetical protein